MRVVLVSLESFYDHSLALDYLVTYALSQAAVGSAVDFDVFVGTQGGSSDGLRERLGDLKPDVVGFNTSVWNVEASVEAAKTVKALLPGSCVVFGGMEATFNAEALLASVRQIDFVILGEGEIPFADLLGRLLEGRAVEQSQPGLAWRDVGGGTVLGGLGAVVTDLNEIPSPFQRVSFLAGGARRVLFESYRGCAFRCSFCLYHRDYARLRYLSLDRVRTDLDAILESGASNIRFVDSTFNLDRGRAKEILRHLRGSGADVCVEVSAEFFDAEMVSLLPSAGVRHIDIGLQSTQRSALRSVQRRWYREERFKGNLALLRAEPALALNVELIAGLPGDDLPGFRASLNDAVMQWPDHVSVYRLLGLKGTQLERAGQRLGLKFAPAPPYELLESPGFPAAVLDQVDALTFAHLMLFNLGVARYALRYFVEILNAPPCQVYDEFLDVVLGDGLYSTGEAQYLGRHHAYGNRFDQPMPGGLELDRVRATVLHFLDRASLGMLPPDQRLLVRDLVDFGHELALLDGVADVARPVPHRANRPGLAPGVHRRTYSAAVIAELERQGQGLGEMTPEEVAAVVFFVHPKLGPAALAIDGATADLLESIGRGVDRAGCAAVDALWQLAILA